MREPADTASFRPVLLFVDEGFQQPAAANSPAGFLSGPCPMDADPPYRQRCPVRFVSEQGPPGRRKPAAPQLPDFARSQVAVTSDPLSMLSVS